MTDSNRAEFAERWAAAVRSFGQPFDAAVAEVGFRVLAEFSIAEIGAALDAAVAGADRMPAPAHLANGIRAVRKRSYLAERTAKLLAEEKAIDRLRGGPAPFRLLTGGRSKPTPKPVPPSPARAAREDETEDDARQRLAGQVRAMGVSADQIEASRRRGERGRREAELGEIAARVAAGEDGDGRPPASRGGRFERLGELAPALEAGR